MGSARFSKFISFFIAPVSRRAAIHLSSSVLLAPRRLRALRQLMTVLLLVLSAVRAWIDDRLSVQMMMYLLLYVASLLHVSVIAVSSAWKTEQ